jgi:hypothetical protein
MTQKDLNTRLYIQSIQTHCRSCAHGASLRPANSILPPLGFHSNYAGLATLASSGTVLSNLAISVTADSANKGSSGLCDSTRTMVGS